MRVLEIWSNLVEYLEYGVGREALLVGYEDGVIEIRQAAKLEEIQYRIQAHDQQLG